MKPPTRLTHLISILACYWLLGIRVIHSSTITTPEAPVNFPGVPGGLSALCSARPSLPINLATMVVHSKRNVSFNFRLYLFSDYNVIQTGQIVPRDNFKIHSFPVKIKSMNEFWPSDVPTDIEGSTKNETSQLDFNSFFSLVPAIRRPNVRNKPKESRLRQSRVNSRITVRASPDDDLLSEDSFADISAVRGSVEDPNENVEYDRDDEVSVIAPQLSSISETEDTPRAKIRGRTSVVNYMPRSRRIKRDDIKDQQRILPVGSFSSFHVNMTYFARKDFDDTKAQLIRANFDDSQFKVTRVTIINDLNNPRGEDYQFLTHKVLTDPDIRITAITQIYEGWISRNYYTLVYTQRRESSIERSGRSRQRDSSISYVYDRLVFRGSSATLLGADQLDYGVKAAAFVTEWDGLDYFFEFMSSSHKFKLSAVDWTRRPYKIFDSLRSTIKATRTLMDNEELILCPPSMCYSNEPIDEVIPFGRLPMNEEMEREASILAGKWPERSNEPVEGSQIQLYNQTAKPSTSIDLAKMIDSVRGFASQLDVRLHLRDWFWNLGRSESSTRKPSDEETEPIDSNSKGSSIEPRFSWNYVDAQRTDIRLSSDDYGYKLTGHDIEASFRVYNQLHLISVSSKHQLLETAK